MFAKEFGNSFQRKLRKMNTFWSLLSEVHASRFSRVDRWLCVGGMITMVVGFHRSKEELVYFILDSL